MKGFRPAKKWVEVSVGESVRIPREWRSMRRRGFSTAHRRCTFVEQRQNHDYRSTPTLLIADRKFAVLMLFSVQ